MAALGHDNRSNYGHAVARQGPVHFHGQQQQQRMSYSGAWGQQQATPHFNRRHNHPQSAHHYQQHQQHYYQQQPMYGHFHGGCWYPPTHHHQQQQQHHHHQQQQTPKHASPSNAATPKASVVAETYTTNTTKPQAPAAKTTAVTSPLELLHCEKMAEYSAFKVDASNAKTVMTAQLKNLVTLILHPNGSEADDTCCTPEGAEGSTAITEEAILAAAAKDMDTLRALMRQHKVKSPLLAAPVLPAVVSLPLNTTTNDNNLTCEGVLADASTAAEPATLAPAVTNTTTIPSLDSSSSSSSSSNSSVVANTPTPEAQESSAPLPGLPSATKTPLKDDTTCISDSTNTRRSSLCGPVVAVPEAGAAVTHPTPLLTPAAIAAVAVTVPATTPTPAAAVVVAVPASPAASSASSSSDSSSPRRHNGKGRNNRRNKKSSSSSSSSGSTSPKAAAAASKALKNLRSPGSAAPSSAWC